MRTAARRALQGAVAFAAMEPVAYSAHRWVMHGPGLAWHESHHRPRPGRVERNDLYPLAAATATIVAMGLGARFRPLRSFVAVGTGVTAYGLAYALAHDAVIHGRVPAVRATAAARGRYARWLRAAHRRHHDASGEPFGMLIPLTGSGSHDRTTRADVSPSRRAGAE